MVQHYNVGDVPGGYAVAPFDAYLQTGVQISKWGVISPENDPSNVISKA